MSPSGDEFLTVAEIAAILKLRVRRSDFEALLERGRTVRPAEPEPSSGQAFWEGELLATPIGEPGDGE